MTKDIACVDLRRFYQHGDKTIRPTRMGIALTFPQWDALMNAAATINNEMDQFSAISTCWHERENELKSCKECTPFEVDKE